MMGVSDINTPRILPSKSGKIEPMRRYINLVGNLRFEGRINNV